ncbi:AzlC family ABC transporter permease [Ammoniphilus sp. CFH 90114]|uniref:AzlC family ABC transporter permease n=1 Tax=Ammoniphilus sp. CFH 90114 TaxID=2493665 RepID=UPI001F0B8DA2|nr:AzlC family ABC transporter permease [Ammoniphilus sp. CFH 90114]
MSNSPQERQWKQGIMDAVPIGLSFLLFGGIFGMMAIQAGLSIWQSVGMSFIVFAGSAQFTSLSMISDQASILAIILATFLINSRHLLMGLSMSPYYAGFSNRFVTLLSFFLIDEQYALTLNRFRHFAPTKSYIMGVSFTLYFTWVFGTFLGTMTGSWIPDPEALGLGFSFTAMFLALVFYQLTNLLRIATFFLCGGLAVALVFVVPNGLHLLIAGVLSFAIGYAFPAKSRKVVKEEQPKEVTA